MSDMTALDIATPVHRYVDVDGVRVFYRAAGPADAPTLLLLHGFPSASHQFRRLVDALGTRYRLVAPDYPGFGHSDAPESATTGGSFVYTFDHLADVVEGFLDHIGLHRFVMYVFDFGAPVGFRIATRHPEWIAGLVVQNGNAYEEGLSPAARDFIALRPDVPGGEERIRELLTLESTRTQYLAGASDPELIAPDGWTLDQHVLDLPGHQRLQIDLAFDYRANVALYPTWQAWLRRHQPPTLITWGKGDPFFTEAGARAYLNDVPHAELHLLDTGHFALEEKLPEIASVLTDFLDRTWPAEADVTSATGADLIRRLVDEAMNGQDLAVIDELYTDALAPKVRQAFEQFRTAFPDWHQELVEIIEDGDTIVARYRCTGTHLGRWQGLAPTGRTMRVDEVHIYRLHGGRIAQVWALEDTWTRMGQLAGENTTLGELGSLS